jgi:hypothetical protein
MTARILGPRKSSRRRWVGAGTGLTLMGLMLAIFVASGSAITQASTCPTLNVLGDSKFEIDRIVPPAADAKKNTLPSKGANLKRDGAAGDCLDWAVIAESRQNDGLTGSGDNAFGQGTSENDAVPTVVNDSIPPNKSDLKSFDVFEEHAGTKTFVALDWSRVNSPQGTTTMDFELNQNSCDPSKTQDTTPPGNICSANNVTPARLSGDKLVIYNLSSGGTVVDILLRTWDGSAWANEVDLDGTGKALGSINYDLIPAGEADGLGVLDPLTFGEAIVDFGALLGSGQTCGTFGSVYLKSRSSDSFTSEIKDFVAPKSVTLSNCTSISTNATASANVGGTISDTATLVGANGPTGSVSFDLYKFTTATPATDVCDLAHKVTTLSTSTWTLTDAATGTYTATVTYPASPGTLGASDLGRYRWIATFAGDVGNSAAGPTECDDAAEISVVSKLPSTVGTAQRFFPNDTATITGTGSFNGTVKFELFHSADCGVVGSDAAVYTKSGVALSGTASGSTATTNNADGSSPTYAINASNNSGSYSWKVTYSGDTTHNDVTSCVETHSITMANGTTVTSP